MLTYVKISVQISVSLFREKRADAEAPVFPMESVAVFAHSECLYESSERSCLQRVVIMWYILLFLCSFLPNYVSHSDKYQQKAFCGVYSEDGCLFLSASQGKLCIFFMVSLSLVSTFMRPVTSLFCVIKTRTSDCMTPPEDASTCGEQWRLVMLAGVCWMSASPLMPIMFSIPAGLITVRSMDHYKCLC